MSGPAGFAEWQQAFWRISSTAMAPLQANDDEEDVTL